MGDGEPVQRFTLNPDHADRVIIFGPVHPAAHSHRVRRIGHTHPRLLAVAAVARSPVASRGAAGCKNHARQAGDTMSGKNGGTILTVDPISCRAHGMCADELPEAIALDEWGYPRVTPSCPPNPSRGPWPGGR